jgi:hypothetical protein
MGNLSVAADKSYPYDSFDFWALVTARCTEAHWSKVPSLGNDLRKVKSPS